MFDLHLLDFSSADWREQVPNIIPEPIKLRRLIREQIIGLRSEERMRIDDRHRETPTHHKWLLASGREVSYKIWLHHYKRLAIRGSGYSQIPHDHRYDFCSLMLLASLLRAFPFLCSCTLH